MKSSRKYIVLRPEMHYSIALCEKIPSYIIIIATTTANVRIFYNMLRYHHSSPISVLYITQTFLKSVCTYDQ